MFVYIKNFCRSLNIRSFLFLPNIYSFAYIIFDKIHKRKKCIYIYIFVITVKVRRDRINCCVRTVTYIFFVLYILYV